ncbi:hypothetical protein [Acinetobacter soli]|uniref:hypothetical protein n=1 Tax=Acinetobacter soli TaxID=487316 RepID=UPI00124F11EF|nr:hypothetical protein [Acinetobacter soli]MEB4799392.1 hypothetical protein [Acinetobacter soli]
MQSTELKQLPDWLLEQLPQMTEPAILSLRDTKLVVTYPDRTETIHDSLNDVQYQIHHVKLTDLQILPEVYQYFGEDKENGGLFFKTSKHLSSRLSSYTDQNKFEHLQSALQTAFENEQAYLTNPTDFLTAYRFIDTHPAFWTVTGDLPSWHWNTRGHCQNVYHGAYNDEDDGKLVIYLETGSHLNKAEDGGKLYQEHYHDYRLDVWADTFEQAFIELAAMVYKFFDHQGIERPDVTYIKPAWVLELQEIMTEVKKWKEEEL